jgi:hypothetical protein
MELIETCINKEPNANPGDVSHNAILFVSYYLHYLDLNLYNANTHGVDKDLY